MRIKPFPVHDENTAQGEAGEFLIRTKESFGMIPNLERVMANAPALLATYSFGWDKFDETSFSPIERQIIYQTANFENECSYCVPWHSLLSEQAGMSKADIDALRENSPLSVTRYQALRIFTRTMIANRGKASPADLIAFFEAGYNQQHALEVILGLAIKTMSNFTNSIAGTPLDTMVKDRHWTKPKIPSATPE